MNEDPLWSLEQAVWTGSTDFYAHSLAPEAVMVFPSPTGVLSRSRILAAVAGAPR